jgi:hypothetical protein
MKALKKLLIAGFVAVTVLGLASTASAKAPKIQKNITVGLFKEKASSPNNAWWVDKATSLIPIKNLKWNAKVFEIETSNSKCKVEARAVGAYYLNICASKSVKPGDKTAVSFLIKQEGKYYLMNTTIRFQKAATPVAVFNLYGKDSVGHLYTKDFVASFANIRTVDWTVPAGFELMQLNVQVAAPQVIDKIVGTLKGSCKEVRLYSGNMYDITKFSSIKVIYKTPLAAAPKYFKVENDAFAGTKRFPVTKYCLVNLK